MIENVETPSVPVTPQAGSAGLATQQPGGAVTVDGAALPTGGIGAGNLIERDIDKELAEFESDDTPLMTLMLNAKKVSVSSPEVDHYMIDEEKTSLMTKDALAATTAQQAVLSVEAEDQGLCQIYGTLRVRGVNGYSEDGQTETPGRDLQLFIAGRDATTNNPIVRAVNGPKTNKTDEYCTIPAIPAGTTIDILGNALHETQRKVEPDSVLPVPTTVYLQKRGMNQVVSDYFDSQKKRIPFSRALIAEHCLKKFKRGGNRTLWVGKKGKFSVQDPETGAQVIYFTEGVLGQFKREVQHTGKWTYEEFIAIAKMFYTGSDVPDGAICLCGKNFLENIQCIDFQKHPEVKIEVKTNKLGWEITSIHTVFGDLEFKREPTLDKIGFSNSAGIFGVGRLVHYQRVAEHKESERIEGHEANRESVIVWDALALKGVCHLFVNGEGAGAAQNATSYKMWDSAAAPTGDDLTAGTVYYLLQDCPGISSKAQLGETWLYGADGTWSEYLGEIAA